MKKFSHLLVWITPLISLIALELIFRRPALAYWLTGAIIILLILTVWLINQRSFKKQFWLFLISPLFFIISETLFVIFLEGFRWRLFLVVILSIFFAVFLENVYIFNYESQKYQRYSLANISNYFNLLIIFLFNSSLFLLVIFFQFPFWLALTINLIVTISLTYQIFWVSRFNVIKAWPYILSLPIILAELFLAVRFLPFSVYNQAQIITLSYYLMIGIGRNRLLGILDKQVVRRYIIITLICAFLILLTAKQS